MFDKKKLNFWRLFFIFAGLTIVTLFFLWSSPQGKPAQMMTNSMGNMMKQMHVSNATIYDFFKMEVQKDQMREMHSHHHGQDPIIYRLNFITTAIVFGMLPFIIGGAVILAIVWIR